MNDKISTTLPRLPILKQRPPHGTTPNERLPKRQGRPPKSIFHFTIFFPYRHFRYNTRKWRSVKSLYARHLFLHRTTRHANDNGHFLPNINIKRTRPCRPLLRNTRHPIRRQDAIHANPRASAMLLPRRVYRPNKVLTRRIRQSSKHAQHDRIAVRPRAKGLPSDFVGRTYGHVFFYFRHFRTLHRRPIRPDPRPNSPQRVRYSNFRDDKRFSKITFVGTISSTTTRRGKNGLRPKPSVRPTSTLQTRRHLIPNGTRRVSPRYLRVRQRNAYYLYNVRRGRRTILFYGDKCRHRIRTISNSVKDAYRGRSPNIKARRLLGLHVTRRAIYIRVRGTRLGPLPLRTMRKPRSKVILASHNSSVVPQTGRTISNHIRHLNHVKYGNSTNQTFNIRRLNRHFPNLMSSTKNIRNKHVNSATQITHYLRDVRRHLPRLQKLIRDNYNIIGMSRNLAAFPTFDVFSTVACVLIAPPATDFSIVP